jgi:hypothetical protein
VPRAEQAHRFALQTPLQQSALLAHAFPEAAQHVPAAQTAPLTQRSVLFAGHAVPADRRQDPGVPYCRSQMDPWQQSPAFVQLDVPEASQQRLLLLQVRPVQQSAPLAQVPLLSTQHWWVV